MKRLPATDELKAKLAAALGSNDFKMEDYAVFETVMNNDLPLSKAGTIYDGAVMTLATLQNIVDQINKEGFLPIHTMHQQATQLPVGRAFHAQMHQSVAASGRTVNEVRALFYIPLTSDQGRQLADGVNTGIINEVSVTARPSALRCSAAGCNFDYMGSNASFMNWLDLTCANDHTIGKDGTHAVFDGTKKVFELSLVSIGAADHARIQTPEQAIAAAGIPAGHEYELLCATKGNEKDTVMELTAAQIAELKADFATRGKAAIDANFAGITGCMAMIKDKMTAADAQAVRDLFKGELVKFDAAETARLAANPAAPANPANATDQLVNLRADVIVRDRQITDLQAQITAKDATLATLTTENSTLKANKIQLDALTAEVTPVKEFLKLACQNLMVASGVKEPVVPESLTELVASIKVAQGVMSKLPTGGLLLQAAAGSTSNTGVTGTKDASAFAPKK